MLGFMSGCAFLSMWVQNTSAVTMVMPIVEAVLQQILKAKELGCNGNVNPDLQLYGNWMCFSKTQPNTLLKSESVFVSLSTMDTDLSDLSLIPSSNRFNSKLLCGKTAFRFKDKHSHKNTHTLSQSQQKFAQKEASVKYNGQKHHSTLSQTSSISAPSCPPLHLIFLILLLLKILLPSLTTVCSFINTFSFQAFVNQTSSTQIPVRSFCCANLNEQSFSLLSSLSSCSQEAFSLLWI